jgi:hypothetical protein
MSRNVRRGPGPSSTLITPDRAGNVVGVDPHERFPVRNSAPIRRVLRCEHISGRAFVRVSRALVYPPQLRRCQLAFADHEQKAS